MRKHNVLTEILSALCIITMLFSLCACDEALSNIGTLDTSDIVDVILPSDDDVPDAPDGTHDDIEANGNLVAHFIDVGQGDSIYIELPNGQNMLIDAGGDYDGNPVVNYLDSRNVGDITYLVATHPHADHINYMSDVVDAYQIENIYMPNATTNTKTFENLLLSIDDKGKKINAVKVGYDILNTNDLKITVLGPTEDAYDNLNLYSVIIKIVYKNTSMLFMGDAETENESALSSSIDVDLVKVGHHGSGTSSSAKFVNKTSADFAIISVGEENSYGHPHDNIVQRWEGSGAEVYTTKDCGTIKATSNGNKITISSIKTPVTDTEDDTETSKDTQHSWILNTNSKKIHKVGCKYAEQISPTNKSTSNKSIQELIQDGYSCCGSCKPTE